MINKTKIILNPDSNEWESIKLSDSIIDGYSLNKFSDNFSLMTAGYRDLLDPSNMNNPEVPFNTLTVAIMVEAKARVFKKKFLKKSQLSVHIGGETRPHTQDFIKLSARIYAANGFQVHLRGRVKTTPIWYSSFGTFYEEYDCADNFTASHSQYFKGGWKPLDFEGKQIVEEEEDIINEVKKIIRERETIHLAPINNYLITKDFDVDESYIAYLKSIIDENMLLEIIRASDEGFKCAAYTMGGSMMSTTDHLFNLLKIKTGPEGTIQYYKGEEDSEYHKIGQVNGENYGVDPGRPEVYRTIGAQDLLDNKKADIVFMWDPDGDRFNIVTIAPISIKDKAVDFGLTVELLPDNNNQCIVYFTPNQIYFMLCAYRLKDLMETKKISNYDWFVVRTVSSTHSIDELVHSEKIPIAEVRVGFKHLGSLSNWIEKQIGSVSTYNTITGKQVVFGKKPRALIMYEESGGATFGGTELLKSKNGNYTILAMREKDGMQVGLFTLALSAYLYNTNISYAEFYIETVEKNNIKNKFFKRRDIVLYDESLMGAERISAQNAGIEKRNSILEYFHDFFEKFKNGTPVEDIQNSINDRLTLDNYSFSQLKTIHDIGDGTLLEYSSFWFLLRASGTDAVLRYYVEGENNSLVQSVLKAFINIKI